MTSPASSCKINLYILKWFDMIKKYSRAFSRTTNVSHTFDKGLKTSNFEKTKVQIQSVENDK